MNISVVLTSFNYASFIGEAIESVLAQTFTDWELIIVDDGSTDNSVEIIQKYAAQDSRIRFFTHPDGKNHGLPATVQLGLSKARFPWVAFLESDDLFMPTSLQEKADVAEKYPESVLIYSDLEMFGESDEEKDFYLRRLRGKLKQLTFPTSLTKEFLEINLIPTFSVVMARKEILEKCNFTPFYPPWLDYWLWVQLAHYPFFFINKPLSRWRIHRTSYLHRGRSQHSWRLRQKQKFQNELQLLKYLPWRYRLNFQRLKLKYSWKKFRQSIISINLNRRRIILLTKEWKW